MGDEQVIAAIGVVRKHLKSEWIVEDCLRDPMLFCASCSAIELDRKLEGLESYLVHEITSRKHKDELPGGDE